MKVLRSSKYRLVDTIDGMFVFERVELFERVSVPQAKFIDETTGNVIFLKVVQGEYVAELSYSTLRHRGRGQEIQESGLLNHLLAQA